MWAYLNAQLACLLVFVTWLGAPGCPLSLPSRLRQAVVEMHTGACPSGISSWRIKEVDLCRACCCWTALTGRAEWIPVQKDIASWALSTVSFNRRATWSDKAQLIWDFFYLLCLRGTKFSNCNRRKIGTQKHLIWRTTNLLAREVTVNVLEVGAS